MSRLGKWVFVLGSVATMAGTPVLAPAQSLYLPRDGKYGVMFEMLKPSFEGLNQDFLSATYFLSGRYGISSRVSLIAEIPYANQSSTRDGYYYPYYLDPYYYGYYNYYYSPYDYPPPSGDAASSTWGNIYVGVEAKIASGPVYLEFGLRPPIASERQVDADLTGIASDVSRWDAFLPKTMAIQAAFDASETAPSGMAYHLRFSPVVTIPTGDNSSDTELYGVYTFLIGYHSTAFRVLGGESGRVLFTEDYGNIGTRTANQLELHADFLKGSIRPGLSFALPLGDTNAYVPMIWGLNVAWSR
jgi:hypothetical protein